VFRRRSAAIAILLALIPVARRIPALGALAIVGAICSAVVTYEVIARRDARTRLRHPPSR
jgi:hypothetical protein